MRQNLIAANWKMNGNRETVGISARTKCFDAYSPRCDVILAPGHLYIGQVCQELDLMNVTVAGQIVVNIQKVHLLERFQPRCSLIMVVNGLF